MIIRVRLIFEIFSVVLMLVSSVFCIYTSTRTPSPLAIYHCFLVFAWGLFFYITVNFLKLYDYIENTAGLLNVTNITNSDTDYSSLRTFAFLLMVFCSAFSIGQAESFMYSLFLFFGLVATVMGFALELKFKIRSLTMNVVSNSFGYLSIYSYFRFLVITVTVAIIFILTGYWPFVCDWRERLGPLIGDKVFLLLLWVFVGIVSSYFVEILVEIKRVAGILASKRSVSVQNAFNFGLGKFYSIYSILLILVIIGSCCIVIADDFIAVIIGYFLIAWFFFAAFTFFFIRLCSAINAIKDIL